MNSLRSSCMTKKMRCLIWSWSFYFTNTNRFVLRTRTHHNCLSQSNKWAVSVFKHPTLKIVHTHAAILMQETYTHTSTTKNYNIRSSQQKKGANKNFTGVIFVHDRETRKAVWESVDRKTMETKWQHANSLQSALLQHSNREPFKPTNQLLQCKLYIFRFFHTFLIHFLFDGHNQNGREVMYKIVDMHYLYIFLVCIIKIVIFSLSQLFPASLSFFPCDRLLNIFCWARLR